jgi:hypothetical protein
MKRKASERSGLRTQTVNTESKTGKNQRARRPKSGQTQRCDTVQKDEKGKESNTRPQVTASFPAWQVQSSPLEDQLLPMILVVLLALLLVASTVETRGKMDRLYSAATHVSDCGVRLLTRGVDPKEGAFSESLIEAPAYGSLDNWELPYRAKCHPSVRPDPDGFARYPSGSELDAIYTAIDALREDEKFCKHGDAIMEIAHKIQVQKLVKDTEGRTSFFTQGGFVLSERLVKRVVETPDSPIAVAELAGILVHEHAHTRQYGAGHSPVVQAFYQIATGLLYIVSLPSEWSGIGFHDQHGQGHGPFEIGPWTLGIEAQKRLLPRLQRCDWVNRVESAIPEEVSVIYGFTASM